MDFDTSHWPFALREMLGIEDDDPAGTTTGSNKRRRVSKPTMRTPATFDLNWDYCENGPALPKPVEHRTTFMGCFRPHYEDKKKTKEYKKYTGEYVECISTALAIVRANGLTCDVPAREHVYKNQKNNFEKEDKKDADEIERENIEYHFSPFFVKRGDDTVLAMSYFGQWIYITCFDEDAADLVQDTFTAEYFALTRIPHRTLTFDLLYGVDNGLYVTYSTGCKDDKDGSLSVSTLFQLQKAAPGQEVSTSDKEASNNSSNKKTKTKTIAKALCTYYNGEMGNSGPTIELFETAQEWQKHGHGSELMAYIDAYFENIFEPVGAVTKRVKYNVCYVTNSRACKWFLHQGFEDWDGMGEELGRHIDYS